MAGAHRPPEHVHGQSIIRSAIKELETNGYLTRERIRDDKGKIVDWLWTFSDYWWMRKIRGGASYSHRYFCLMALAIYAVKCGITDRDRVKADMESLVPFLDSIDPEHPFGNDHEVENALECLDLRYKKFPIKDLERISGMAIPKNKRNYRKQPQHMEYLNGLRKMRRDVLGENEYENSGRPKGSGEKCELIRSYAREHPDANHSDIAKALGVSRTTVIKWLRDWKRDTDGLPDGAWYEGGHIHVDMTEPKAD